MVINIKAMKNIAIIIISLFSIQMNAQKMNTPEESVLSLFISTDKQDWINVSKIFSEEVLLDYSSMNGNPTVTLKSEEIITPWKTILPGFTHTHHQIGNVQVITKGDSAHVFCYGTATHFLEDENGNVWTVVGSYDFDLRKSDGAWRITSMKFNFKYQDGNTDLATKAINNLK